MATNQQSKRPATTLRCGNIKATIWQNVRDPSSGRPFLVHLRIRPVPGAMAPRSDLVALMNVAFQAKEWMTAHTLKH